MTGQFSKVFTNKRIAITFLLAFSSGLPLPLVWGTLKGWLTYEKVDLKTVALFSFVTLPYSIKFLWAPIIDRYVPPFLNRRTGWMVIIQLLLIPSLCLMGMTNPQEQKVLLAALAMWTAFLSATQDIVIDAYRTELLKPEELGPGAAITVMGARVGLLVSGSLAFILADQISWKYVYIIMSGLMLIGVITACFAPAPEGESKPPKSLKDAIIDPFKVFFKNPRSIEILLFILFFKLGDVVAGEMMTPFFIKSGYSMTAIGAFNKGFGMLSTIVGAMIGGAVVSRIGIWGGLLIFGILQSVSNLTFVVLAKIGLNYPAMITAIGIENFCTGLSTAAFVAFLMSLCDKRFSATQYALLSSLMALSRPFIGGATGYLVEFGWPVYFTVSTFLGIPGLLLLLRFRKFSTATNGDSTTS